MLSNKFAPTRMVKLLFVGALATFGNSQRTADAFPLAWNTTTGNFNGSPTWTYDNAGVLTTSSNPFTLPGGQGANAGGENLVRIGNNGIVTLDTPNQGPLADNSLYEIRVGTNSTDVDFTGLAGPNLTGNGTLTVQGTGVGLRLFDTDAGSTVDTGGAFIGEGAGITGTLNWNSTGTLDVQGQFRVGRSGGTGVVNQNDGIVQAGTTAGTLKFIAMGDGAGSSGTYNLNNGALYPDGLGYPGAADRIRQFRVGISGAIGVLNVGDGVGAAGSAVFESEDDLLIGDGTGSNSTLHIKSDGVIRLLRAFAGSPPPTNEVDSSDFVVGQSGATGLVIQDGGSVAVDGPFRIGRTANGMGEYRLNSGTIAAANDGDGDFFIGSNAGKGLMIQNGGSVTTNDLVSIGQDASSVGEYRLFGGSLAAALDGADAFRIGGGSGNGTLRVQNNATFSTLANLVIAQGGNAATSVGLLELTGSQASFQAAKLENQTGANHNETISWIADANGVTPIVVNGGFVETTPEVDAQLQSVSENTANTGTNGGLVFNDFIGNGTRLMLNLSALTSSQTLTLIDNRSADPMLGFFDNGTTDLYEEGESILGTGFNGSVNISYLGSAPTGSTGNDVVLTLVAASLPGDHNEDGIVDAADYVFWRKTNVGGALGYTDWRTNFARTNSGSGGGAGQSGQVPEPAAACLIVIGMAGVAGYRRRAL